MTEESRTFDYLIVGAGFSGLVFAQRASAAGYRCLVVDTREHIGGNCYDYFDENGILLHKYGPHYFRTNSSRILAYLSQFTQWRKYDFIIKSFDQGRYYSFPINLNTFEEITGCAATESDFESWIEGKRFNIEKPMNSEEVILAQVGRELYEKFFEGYTLKHWGRHPRDLDASVCARIPIRLNRDNRYLKEDFQALPLNGYTALFENMLASCGANCRLDLNTSFEAIENKVTYRKLVYSGAIDSFYGYRFGHLPYRSLRFETETYSGRDLEARVDVSGKSGYWQPTVQVNYPNENEYTRIVEIKHATGQISDSTTIVKEYPLDYKEGYERFYPVPAPDAAALYAKYSKLAALEQNVVFIGRLAKYRYYNMDQIVGMALAAADKEFKE